MIPIDPELPEDFDDTPNDERPDSHQAWWYVPYIVTVVFRDESYDKMRERYRRDFRAEPDSTRDEWDEMQKRLSASWLKSYPSGTRYTVRCLDGGAWDRSTNYGSFADLDEALEVAKDLGPLETYPSPDN